MYRYLHISIGPALGYINHNAIQARLSDLGGDWMNYNTNCWVLWTNKSPITVSEMIQGHLASNDQLLVLGLSSLDTPSGSMPQWAWDWLNRPRDPNTGAVLTPALPAPAAINLFAKSALEQAIERSLSPPTPPLPKLK